MPFSFVCNDPSLFMNKIPSFLFIPSCKWLNLRQIFFVSLLYRVFYLLLNLKVILFQTFSPGFASLLQKGNSNLKKCHKELKTLCTKRQISKYLFVFHMMLLAVKGEHSCTISLVSHLILMWTSWVFAVWRSRDFLFFRTNLIKWKL